jgi:hypothetical protein
MFNEVSVGMFFLHLQGKNGKAIFFVNLREYIPGFKLPHFTRPSFVSILTSILLAGDFSGNRTTQLWNQLPEDALGTLSCKPSSFRKGVRKVINKTK